MRRLFVVVCCAAFTLIGGAHATAQVLPPPYPTNSESPAVSVLDVWAGLKSIL